MDRPEFLHRVIRIIGIITLAYAALHLLQAGLYIVIRGSLWFYARGDFGFIERAVQLSHLGVMLLLLAVSIGLLKWKPWSRPAVMLWAVLTVVLHFASSAMWAVRYARDMSRATT
ncbi:MAG: hypothetical protein QOF78_1312 [Phycisphaerales bacterium]|jgi:hypothetical protein|nr:hypothetical protein [Phycisphaerales bacterium]